MIPGASAARKAPEIIHKFTLSSSVSTIETQKEEVAEEVYHERGNRLIENDLLAIS